MVIETAAIIKLVLAVVIGGAIGWQREHLLRPAGMRTHMLVCMSATLLTISAVTSFGFEESRIIAGIVTGMGFLGAGTIFRDDNHVHGLTAASLWTTAAIGIAIAIETYQIVLVATLLVLFILSLNRFEKSKLQEQEEQKKA